MKFKLEQVDRVEQIKYCEICYCYHVFDEVINFELKWNIGNFYFKNIG